VSESEISFVRPVNGDWRKGLKRRNPTVRGMDRVIALRAAVLETPHWVGDGIPPLTESASTEPCLVWTTLPHVGERRLHAMLPHG